MLLNMETSEITKVPDSLDCGAPSWSPDGKALALVCGRDTKSIYLMRLPDYGRIPLTTWQEERESQLSPEWSPDGKWLAFLNYIGGQRTDPREGIFLMDSGCLAEREGCRQATHGPLECVEWFVWSNDSTAIGCVEGSNIRFIDISTGRSWEMHFPRSVARFAGSPSGEQLAVSLAASSGGQYTDVFVRDSGNEAFTQITQGQGDKYVRFWLVVR
jgi:Tol biopolymer transport system component